MTEKLIIILGAIALVALITAATSIGVWLLWNWLMPAMFALGKITFWQALGLNVLCNILFKSTFSEINKK